MRVTSLLAVTKLSSTWVENIICWSPSFLTHIDFSHPTNSNPSDFNHFDHVLCKHLSEWVMSYSAFFTSYTVPGSSSHPCGGVMYIVLPHFGRSACIKTWVRFCTENVILLCEFLLTDHSSSSWLGILGQKDLSFRLLPLFSIVSIASYSRALSGSEWVRLKKINITQIDFFVFFLFYQLSFTLHFTSLEHLHDTICFLNVYATIWVRIVTIFDS